MELGYVGIASRNVEAWRSFAIEVLGTPVVTSDDDGSIYLRVDLPHHRIAVHPGSADGLQYVGWVVRDHSALQAAKSALDARGVPHERGTDAECARRRVQEFIHLRDPAGNRIELCHGLKWLVDLPDVSPTRPISGLRGLGHIVIGVSDPNDVRDFYESVLGLRLTDYRSGAIYFLRCNSVHHSIAIARSDKPGLHHIFLQVESIDDVGRTYDLAVERGIASASIGRHGNDRAITCYIKSPSNFQIEYGCGGILVDESSWTAHEYSVGDLWGHQRAEEESIVLSRTLPR